MNILVSDKWLREYVRTPKTPEELAARISEIGPSVERITRQGADLAKVVVGRVLEVLPHPNADKLRLAKTDVGNKTLTIVCGGSNLYVGMFVAVALVGARVRWHGEGELVTLEPATIRGVASEGMICAANEVGLHSLFPHGEREVMDLSGKNVRIGSPLAVALGLEDAMYEIEVTTNRPDAVGIVGVAREAAAATGGVFLWKELPIPKPARPAAGVKPIKLAVSVTAKKLCGRYRALQIDGVVVGPSPAWMQERLSSAGLRPINAVVDITNYVMLELGQPLHAFDADTVRNGAISVRTARSGEKMMALDGNEYELSEDMLVIANGAQPLAVAGVIGGEASKVHERTTRIILESASFNGASIRKTARALGVRTDAVIRFEKGIPQGLTAPALARATQLVREICGGTVMAVSDVIEQKEKLPKVSIPFESLVTRIGVKLSPAEVKKLLASIGIAAMVTPKMVSVTVPYWRAGDIALPEDIVEEVARLYGYHKLPAVLPPGISGEAPSPVFKNEKLVRDALISCGASEVISISLVGEDLLRRSGETSAVAVRLANPLNADVALLRPSHRGRLLEVVRDNEKLMTSGVAFEIGNIFIPQNAGHLPTEMLSLGVVAWGSQVNGELFYQLKGILGRVAASLRTKIDFAAVKPHAFWHPGRSADVSSCGKAVGTVGELTPSARREAGIEQYVAFAEVQLEPLFASATDLPSFTPIPPFPPVLRDIAILVDRDALHANVVDTIKKVDPLIADVELFDHYEGKGIPEGKKSLAYHLTYQSVDRTLTSAEIDAIQNRVAAALKSEFGATIRE